MEMFRNTRQPPLVIHCNGDDPQQLRWYYREHDGSLRSGCQHTPLPTIPACEVRLLLPASQMIFHTVLCGPQPAQTLSWQLESLALAEPETLHTVVLARDNQQLHLAAIDRQWLHQLLDNVHSLGVRVTRALPDVLALAEQQALVLEQRWLIRHQRWRGISLTAQQLAVLLPQEPALAAALSSAQQHELAVALPAEQQQMLATLFAAGEEPPQAAPQPASRQVTSADQQPAAAQLYDGACQQTVNVLQGEFAVRLSLRHARAFALACALCSTLIMLIPPLWSSWQAGNQARNAQQQSLALYQRYFPGEPPQQPARDFATRMAALAAAPQAEGPLRLLGESAAMLATLQDNALQTLLWDEKQQQLHLSFARALPATGLESNGLHIRVEDHTMIIGRKP